MANFTWPINPSTSGPVQFILDGNVETVNQDTSTPSNSIPLPVINLDGSGVEVDYATEAKQDTQITEAQSTNTKLDTLNANDFATEAKQDAQIIEAQSTNTKLDAVIAEQLDQTAELVGINSELDAQTALLTSIDADTSVINTQISAINQKLAASFFTLPYDRLEVTIKTADGPTRIVSSLASVTVQTLDITYDIDGDFESAEVS